MDNKMNICPSCGEYGQGKLWHICLTKNDPVKKCMGILEDGSKCQEPVEDDKLLCLGCLNKLREKIKRSTDEKRLPLSHEETIELIKSIPNEPGRTDEEMSELRSIASGEVPRIIEFIEKINNSWKDVTLDIGVTGQSGAGKSSFINSIRGVKKYDPGYAPVGVTETTTSIEKYTHPSNPKVNYWDMPGVGTPDFPKSTYLELIQFKKYDFFLILSEKRFRDDDGWLANQIEKSGRSFYFVRTHIDSDVDNDKREDPKHHSKEKVLEKVQKSCQEHLSKAVVTSAEVFLIDNREVYDYDFPNLTERLLNSKFADNIKRTAFILSLSILTKEVIEEKRKALKVRIWKVAMKSAISGNIPDSKMNCVQGSLMIDEFNEYRRQFGLTDERLQHATRSKIAMDLRTKYARYMENILKLITVEELIETALKHGFEIFGSIASGIWSFAVIYCVLTKLLNVVVDDAEMLRKEAVELLNPPQ